MGKLIVDLALACLTLASVFAGVLPAVHFRYRVLGRHTLLLMLFAVAGISDVLATVELAFSEPEKEGNPIVREFLKVPYAIFPGIVLWAAGWLALAELLERMGKPLFAQITIAGLALGHGRGFLTWTGGLGVEGTLITLCVSAFAALLLYSIYKWWYKNGSA